MSSFRRLLASITVLMVPAFVIPDEAALGQTPLVGANATAVQKKAPPNRGRIQAQGGAGAAMAEKSVKWAQDDPPTVAEGLKMLDDLYNSLTAAQKAARKQAFKDARNWIQNVAGKAGGVDAPLSKTFKEPGTKDVRVDIEVIKGKAFVPK